jgi:hypothetical protein
MSPDRSSPPSIVVSAHRAHGSRDALKTIIPPLMIEMSEAAPWNFSASAEVHFCWIVRRSFNDRGDGLVLELPEDGPSCSGWSCPVETMFAAPESDESDPS